MTSDCTSYLSRTTRIYPANLVCTGRASIERDCDEMRSTNVTVLYASETGTAQDVAEQFWKSAKRKGISATVSALDDYEIQNLPSEKLAIFVVATTGQGDPPRNMRKFWRLILRKNLPSGLLANLKFAVLGLGDSSYQKFNFAAKKAQQKIVTVRRRGIITHWSGRRSA